MIPVKARWTLALVAGFAITGAVAVTSAAFTTLTSNSGSSFAAATSFCTPVTETLTASADSYVDGALLSGGSNFGTAPDLQVRSSTLGNRRTLVRFTLPAVPSHCSLTGATLQLYAGSAGSGRTLQAFRADASWTENGVTWNSMPATAGTAATTASGTGWREWNVTAHVQAMYSETNNGFVVRDSSEGALAAASQTFASREASSNRPALVLTFG